MRIDATAPGKLVLLGEYAVLEGAPALVMAVNRRARARLTRIDGETSEIVSTTLGHVARCRVRGDRVRWIGRAPPDEFAWIETVFGSGLIDAALPAFRAELETGGFYLEHHRSRMKLGLGSSAALTVAFAGALRALAQQPAPSLAELVALHRRIQQGRGSGVDVAAASQGGLSCYRLDGDVPRCEPLRMPDALRWCCVFTGQSASTATMLRAIEDWRGRAPEAYERHMDELAGIAAEGIDAVMRDDPQAFLDGVGRYSEALAGLGAEAGAEIVSEAHKRLGRIAASSGTVYKSCGAGGGDTGITFGMHDRQLREFRRHAEQAGFPVIELHQDPKGLEAGFTV